MKKVSLILTAAVLLVTVGAALSSCSSVSDSAGLAYIEENGSITITGMGSCDDTVLRIPKKIGETPVTAIASCAFEDADITGVNIPDSVTSLGEDAFEGCEKLTRAALPGSLTRIPDNCFKNCTALKTLALENGVVTIGRSAFENCPSLTSLFVPSSVTELEKRAFAECRSLACAEFDKGVRTVGDEAFMNCRSLKTVKLPKSLENIGKRAFSGCSSLEDFIVPKGVVDLGKNVFEGCENLNKLKFERPAGWQNSDGGTQAPPDFGDPKQAAEFFRGGQPPISTARP